MKVTRVHATADGESHVDEVEMRLNRIRLPGAGRAQSVARKTLDSGLRRNDERG